MYCGLSLECTNATQITTQIQKLELDWPEQIRGFFQTLNLLSLSLSALSPRCVVSDWQYLNKVPITNAAPIGIFAFLLIHQYVVPRISHALRTVCKALLPSIMAPTKVSMHGCQALHPLLLWLCYTG